jgi:pimeloyl-ACP methyl ester carboxylesterase
MKDEVEKAKLIASSTTDEGIIAALKGMKDRKDRTYVLKNIEVPVFFGIGKKDNYIPIEKIMALTELPKQKHITIFENSGHMGFIEERDYAIDEIEQFIEMC